MTCNAGAGSSSSAVNFLRKESQGARKETRSKSCEGSAGRKCKTRRQVLGDAVIGDGSSGWVHLLTKAERGDLPLHFYTADCVSTSPPQGFVGMMDKRSVGRLMLVWCVNPAVVWQMQRQSPGRVMGGEGGDLWTRVAT